MQSNALERATGIISDDAEPRQLLLAEGVVSVVVPRSEGLLIRKYYPGKRSRVSPSYCEEDDAANRF